MNIWLVSIFENTPIDDNLNTRYNSIAREANLNNHQVTYWASTFRHNIKKQRFDSFKEIKINDHLQLKFVEANSYKKNISVARLYSHYKLAKEMVGLFDAQPMPDVIVVAFPPISLALEVINWAKKNKVPVIIDIIDPWPNAFLEQIKGIKKIAVHIGILPLKYKAKIVFRQASGIMSISEQYLDFAKSYRKSNVPSQVFYPAVQFDVIKEQLRLVGEKNTKDPNLFIVVYAGSLGFSYDIPTILKAAEILERKKVNIQFMIAGDGPQKNIVELYEKGHTNLKYLGRVSKEKLMEIYFLADVGLTQHVKGATQSVTYKLFDLLACGLPILNSLESEMKSIILNNQVGYHNAPGDVTQLVNNILLCSEDSEMLNEMSQNALALTAISGDSAIVYKKALDFMESQVIK
jgi:glycosyltransferase involved in cell wall biosynthesis